MKKVFIFSFCLIFVLFSILLVIFSQSFADRNISVKASITETFIEQGSINEPIFNNTEADFENFIKVSNMTHQEAINVKENPEHYLFITYTIEIENAGEKELVLKDLGQLENKEIWLLNELDGYLPIPPQDTTVVNVFLVGKNCEENINNKFTIPLIFELSYGKVFSYLKNTITVWAS